MGRLTNALLLPDQSEVDLVGELQLLAKDQQLRMSGNPALVDSANSADTFSNVTRLWGERILDVQVVDCVAERNSLVLVDTDAGPITVEAPADAKVGDTFAVLDVNEVASVSNNITVEVFTNAGYKLHGANKDYTIKQDRGFARFLYLGATWGWVLIGESILPVEPGEDPFESLTAEITTGPTPCTLGAINLVDVTSSALTVTAPTGVSAGQWFAVSDSRANAGTNNITVDINSTGGAKLHGAAADYVISADRGYAKFRYVNATVGWIVEL